MRHAARKRVGAGESPGAGIVELAGLADERRRNFARPGGWPTDMRSSYPNALKAHSRPSQKRRSE